MLPTEIIAFLAFNDYAEVFLLGLFVLGWALGSVTTAAPRYHECRIVISQDKLWELFRGREVTYRHKTAPTVRLIAQEFSYSEFYQRFASLLKEE